MDRKAHTLAETVKQFYNLLGGYTNSDFSINQPELEALLNLFSDHIYYNRCGKIIEGKDALRKFYEHERRLYGKHTLDKIVVDESDNGSAAVLGTFDGVNKAQKRLLVRFSDFFSFNSQGKISFRETLTAQI